MNMIKSFKSWFQSFKSKEHKFLLVLLGYLLGSYFGLGAIVSWLMNMPAFFIVSTTLLTIGIAWIFYAKYKLNDDLDYN